MNVALYAGSFRRNRDGATRTLYNLVTFLGRRGQRTGVWAYEHSEPLLPGMQAFTLPSLPLPLSPDYRLSLPFWGLSRALDSFAPDVVHVTVPDLVGLFFLRYARLRGIPSLCTFHTDFVSYLPSFGLGLLEKGAWRYLRWFYDHTDRVLAPTRAMIRQLDRQGIGAGLWSRGIDLDHFHPSFRSQDLRKSWGAEEKLVVLYVGRLVPYKSLDQFCGVYRYFARQGWLDQTRFVLVGEGREREVLAARMPEAVFTGHLSGHALSEAWASGDILLFPSGTETFGNVVQEALASGLPVVVSDRGGCCELARCSGGGLICHAGQVDDFARSCRSLLVDSVKRRKCADRGMSWVRGRSWDRVNQAVLSTYTALVRRSGAGRVLLGDLVGAGIYR